MDNTPADDVSVDPNGSTGDAGKDRQFSSYSQLRDTHERLTKAHAAARTEKQASHEADTPAILAFVEKARATGSILSREDERRAAQTILDYWSAELITSSAVGDKDWSPAALSPCLTGTDPSHALDPTDISPAAAARRRRAREQIRLSAVVRRWRDSGESNDYLLSGSALDEAEDHMDLDPGIKALVLKSRSLERRRTKRRWIGFSAAIAVLSALCVALAILWQFSENHRRIAEVQRAEAEKQTERAIQQTKLANRERLNAEKQKNIATRQAEMAENQRKEAESQKLEAEKQQEVAEAKQLEAVEAFEVAQTRVSELEQAQTQLDMSLRVINRAVNEGSIKRATLPPDVLAALDNAVSSRYEFPTLGDPFMTGYNPDFLGFVVRRPKLSPDLEASAFLGGGSLHYVNYSLTFDEQKRQPIFSASNLDRSQLLVLPRVSGAVLKDPRVPPEMQPDLPDRGTLPGSGHMPLVGGEIAWGAYFQGAEYEASDKLAGVTRVFPNIIPAPADLDRRAWSEIDRWILTEHNKSANNVIIYSGPIPGAEDQVVDGVRISKRYWKIAVSRAPLTRASDQVDALHVDAFVVGGQRTVSAGGAVDRGGNPLFNLNAHRVGINEVERLTGLTFDDKIRQADARILSDPGHDKAPGQDLAESVGLLNSPQNSARTSTTQQMVSALGPKGIGHAGQEKIVTALLDQLDALAAPELTTTGLYNYTLILSRVPFQTWNLESWNSLRIRALKAMRKLETQGRRGEIRIAPKARQNINDVKGNLGAETTGLETIEFRFDGISRSQAVEISFALQEMGWDIPGEERTGTVSGLNEVRYGAEIDQATAQILAEDLQTLWQNGACCKVVQNDDIKPGFLEISISD